MGKLIRGIARKVNIPEENPIPVSVSLGRPPLIGLFQEKKNSQDCALGNDLAHRPPLFLLDSPEVLP
jgi:hypothetical protein